MKTKMIVFPNYEADIFGFYVAKYGPGKSVLVSSDNLMKVWDPCPVWALGSVRKSLEEN